MKKITLCKLLTAEKIKAIYDAGVAAGALIGNNTLAMIEGKMRLSFIGKSGEEFYAEIFAHEYGMIRVKMGCASGYVSELELEKALEYYQEAARRWALD